MARQPAGHGAGVLYMDASLCSPYPHYSWFAHWILIQPPNVFQVYECRHVTHRLLLTTHGDADVSWATQGTATAFHTAAGGIGFFPCDRDTHTMSITSAGGYKAYSLCIPDDQLRRICTSEGVPPVDDFHAIPFFRNSLLEASLLRLSTGTAGRQVSEDIGDEIAARQVVLRLCAAVGGRPPDWQRDSSVFTPCIMRQIVEQMDATLGCQVSLEEMARNFALSPGHFARKFQQSAGLSLDRFMNNRRIGMACSMLQEGSCPLSRISLDLGFSSQSHFTRLFSRLTGMTPQRFRRLHLHMNK